VLRVHQPGMAEPKRSRQVLRRSDMSKFGVEAEVVCACSQRRPQDLVAPLMTTGQLRCRCRDRTATIAFMSSAVLRDVAGNVGRGFQLLRATTCATTARIGVFGARRLGSNGKPAACRAARAGQLADHDTAGPTRGCGRSGTAAEWRVLLQLVQGAPAKVSCTTSSASIMCATSFDDTCVF
jgi:hypothetical protein